MGVLVVTVAVVSGLVLHLVGMPGSGAAAAPAPDGPPSAVPYAAAASPGPTSTGPSASPDSPTSTGPSASPDSPASPDGVSRASDAETSGSEDVAATAATAVQKAVRPLDAEAAGRVSVAVADLATGVSASYTAAGGRFVTASVAKADILASLLLQAQQTGRHLTAQEKALATTMIENSDNTAADALYSRIGLAAGMDKANAVFGLQHTTSGASRRWGLTSTTAEDQLQLLQQIFGSGSALSSASREYLSTLMGQVEADQNWGVSAAADSGSTVRLKNGWLPRSTTGLWVINSIGLVEHDGRRLLIVALSDGNSSQTGGISLVESAARAAADALTDALEAHA